MRRDSQRCPVNRPLGAWRIPSMQRATRVAVGSNVNTATVSGTATVSVTIRAGMNTDRARTAWPSVVMVTGAETPRMSAPTIRACPLRSNGGPR